MSIGGLSAFWMPGVASKTPSLRLSPFVRTKPSWMPSGDQAGIRSGSAVVMGDGAGVSCVSVGHESVWRSTSLPLARSSAV